MSSPHEAFWVAIATGAPVVALGHVFAIDPAFRAARANSVKAEQIAKHPSRPAINKALLRSPATYLWITAVLAIVTNAMVLWNALDSLANERDEHSTFLASLFLVITVVLLVSQAVLASYTPTWTKRTLDEYDQFREAELAKIAAEAYGAGEAQADTSIAQLKAEIASLDAETAEGKHQWRTQGVAEPDLYGDHYENFVGTPSDSVDQDADGRSAPTQCGIDKQEP